MIRVRSVILNSSNNNIEPRALTIEFFFRLFGDSLMQYCRITIITIFKRKNKEVIPRVLSDASSLTEMLSFVVSKFTLVNSTTNINVLAGVQSLAEVHSLAVNKIHIYKQRHLFHVSPIIYHTSCRRLRQSDVLSHSLVTEEIKCLCSQNNPDLSAG